MLSTKAGGGCCRCGETLRALPHRRGRNSLSTFLPTEVGIVGIELELYLVLQAIEHCMKHIGVFGEESRVYAQVKNHRLPERTVQQAIGGCKVIRAHGAWGLG